MTNRAAEYGSSSLPTTPEVIAKPRIIISHTVVAAPARRGGSTRLASNASSEVPAALTPTPMIRKASTAEHSAATRWVPRLAVAAAARHPPSAIVAIPPRIHGVRRAP